MSPLCFYAKWAKALLASLFMEGVPAIADDNMQSIGGAPRLYPPPHPPTSANQANKKPQSSDWGFFSRVRRSLYAKWAKALLASAMRWVFSRFWMVAPVLL